MVKISHMQDQMEKEKRSHCKTKAAPYRIMTKTAFKVFIKNFPAETCQKCWTEYNKNPQTW